MSSHFVLHGTFHGDLTGLQAQFTQIGLFIRFAVHYSLFHVFSSIPTRTNFIKSCHRQWSHVPNNIHYPRSRVAIRDRETNITSVQRAWLDFRHSAFRISHGVCIFRCIFLHSLSREGSVRLKVPWRMAGYFECLSKRRCLLSIYPD